MQEDQDQVTKEQIRELRVGDLLEWTGPDKARGVVLRALKHAVWVWWSTGDTTCWPFDDPGLTDRIGSHCVQIGRALPS